MSINEIHSILPELLALQERYSHMTFAEVKLEEAEAKVKRWQACAERNVIARKSRLNYLTSEFGDLEECGDEGVLELISDAQEFYDDEQSSRDWGVEIWEKEVNRLRQIVNAERVNKEGRH